MKAHLESPGTLLLTPFGPGRPQTVDRYSVHQLLGFCETIAPLMFHLMRLRLLKRSFKTFCGLRRCIRDMVFGEHLHISDMMKQQFLGWVEGSNVFTKLGTVFLYVLLRVYLSGLLFYVVQC